MLVLLIVRNENVGGEYHVIAGHSRKLARCFKCYYGEQLHEHNARAQLHFLNNERGARGTNQH